MRNKIIEVMSEDIVITGISGRFPESDSIDEFANNLYNRVDMITEDNRRWPTGLNKYLSNVKFQIIYIYLFLIS